MTWAPTYHWFLVPQFAMEFPGENQFAQLKGVDWNFFWSLAGEAAQPHKFG